MDRTVRTVDDVFELLDGLFASRDGRWATGDGAGYWDRFYADRSKPVPFFVAKPDEGLAGHIDRGLIRPAGRWTSDAVRGAMLSSWRPGGSRWTRWTSRRRLSPGPGTGLGRWASKCASSAATRSGSPARS
jgi:hypothetical protein